MIQRCYVIMDELAEEAGPIFLAKNDAVAARNSEKAIAEAAGDDYKLYSIGEYDNVRCLLTPFEKPREVKLSRAARSAPVLESEVSRNA